MVDDVPYCNPDLTPKQISFPEPKIVHKGWGYEKWIANSNDYCGKILHFKAGKRCSLHYHIEKKEHFLILTGSFLLKYIDTSTAKEECKFLKTGDIVEIPRGCPHQMICSEYSDGEIMEVSTTDYPFDSYRLFPGDSQASPAS